MDYVELAARLMLAAVFCLAVGGKIRSADAFRSFAVSLRTSIGTPAALTTPAAIAVVLVEATVAALLLVPASARLGAAAAAAVLAAFTIVTAWLVHRRTTAACNCFGAGGTRFAPRHVIRNALLTAIAAFVMLAGPSPGVHAAVVVVAGTAGLVLALLVTRWDDLAALIAPVSVSPDPRAQSLSRRPTSVQ